MGDASAPGSGAGAPEVVASLRRGRCRAWWTGRGGGASAAPYDDGNLADHVGDDTAAVIANRGALARALGLPEPDRWCWLRQVHGATVHRARGVPEAAPVADAAVTEVPDLPLAVVTADCAPLLLVADRAVGVVHAGWPGLVAGVVEAAVAALAELGGPVRDAVLGPCVHPGRYEFGADDLDRVARRLGPQVVARTDDGAPALDVPTAVRVTLGRAGVDDLEVVDRCTHRDDALFSHRRDGVTGRQALVAVLDA